jgi:hypothetical protein
MTMMPVARAVRATESQEFIIMSKHNKIVTVAVDTHTKLKLANAGNAVAELATAVAVGSDDHFGPKGSRRR